MAHNQSTSPLGAEALEGLMRRAIELSENGPGRDANPQVGAILLNAAGDVIAEGWHRGAGTPHAEIDALSQVTPEQARGGTLVVTLEPCVMCAGAIVAARIPRVVFGAWDSRVGAGGSLYDLLRDGRLGRPVEVIGGVLEAECSALMTQFFEAKRMSGSR
jgi:tRNA(adenine34) deaminase